MTRPTYTQRSAFITWQRSPQQQFSLDGAWELAHTDLPADPLVTPDLAGLRMVDWTTVQSPGMIQWQWYQAGKGPHPYEELNSKAYLWMEERAWWYRRIFTLPAGWNTGERCELVFDGLDHDARIWLDGQELGSSEGAFGGPVFNVTACLAPGQPHELLVRLIPCGTDHGALHSKAGRLIKPPSSCRWINNPDLMTCGIWRSVRLVATGRQRLERPFLHTLSASPEKALVRLEIEILAAQTTPHEGFIFRNSTYPQVHRNEYSIPAALDARLLVEIVDAHGRLVCSQIKDIHQTVGRQWLEMDLEIDRPQLWNPVNLGEPYLYRCSATLLVENHSIDRIELPLGIRTIEWKRSAAQRVQDPWFGWLPVINGREAFLTGINWMPIDLFQFRPEKYRWFLLAAKEAGVQMLRVWGGGSLELELFYDLCDELGILVWQDFPVNSGWECRDFPLDVWEDQVMWNVFRLRSRPSLAVWCGGNEFNPYHPANAAVVGIMERSLQMLDGTRPFIRACCDPADIHPYPDCDITWYWTLFNQTPAITEWGSHALPTLPTLAEILPPEEFERRLGDLTGLDEVRFNAEHPALRNHWAEFGISRVPRTIARAAILADVSDPTLSELVEAVQVGAGEVYSTVIRSFRANYPTTTLVMPWVYNRPWPSVGMQMIDHSGRLTAGYYAMKQSYSAGQVALVYPFEILAPGEVMTVRASALHNQPSALPGAQVVVEVFSGRLERLARYAWPVTLSGGPDPAQAGTFELEMPGGGDTAVLIRADLLDATGALRGRSLYWLRTSAELAAPETRAAYRAKAQTIRNNTPEGRVLPLVAQSATHLSAAVLASRPLALPDLGLVQRVEVELSNRGNFPAVFTHWVWNEKAWLLLAEDNYFWLEPGESRRLTLTFAQASGISAWQYPGQWQAALLKNLGLTAWNAPQIEL